MARACIVERQVEPAEFRQRLFDKASNGFGISDVRWHRERIAAFGLDVLGDGLDCRLGSRGQHDRRPRFGESSCGGCTDAAARAGDDGDLALEQPPRGHAAFAGVEPIRRILCTRPSPVPMAARPTSRCKTWMTQCQLLVSRFACVRPRIGAIKPHATAAITMPRGTPARAPRKASVHSDRTSTKPRNSWTGISCSALPVQKVSPSRISKTPDIRSVMCTTVTALLMRLPPQRRLQRAALVELPQLYNNLNHIR